MRAIAVTAAACVVGITPPWPIRAQQPPPKFEAASVKPNHSGVRRYEINPRGDRFVATNADLLTLVEWAYRFQPFQISGAPSWMGSDRFDVEATSDGSASIDQFRSMLQPLLADRFNLKVHRERKTLPIYELVVAKGGPKLKAAGCVGTPSPANPCGGTSGSAGRGTLIGRAVPIEILASDLSGLLRRSVVDKTRLRGTYDVDLTWTPDETARQGRSDLDPPPAGLHGPSIFTAVQEQIGLKLNSAKGPVEVLVIDSVRKPAEN